MSILSSAASPVCYTPASQDDQLDPIQFPRLCLIFPRTFEHNWRICFTCYVSHEQSEIREAAIVAICMQFPNIVKEGFRGRTSETKRLLPEPQGACFVSAVLFHSEASKVSEARLLSCISLLFGLIIGRVEIRMLQIETVCFILNDNPERKRILKIVDRFNRLSLSKQLRTIVYLEGILAAWIKDEFAASCYAWSNQLSDQNHQQQSKV